MNRCELRLGKWETALADVGMIDVLICDPPYSQRTHTGHNDGMGALNRVSAEDEMKYGGPCSERGNCAGEQRASLDYVPWTVSDVTRFVEHWSPRVRGWMACFTDHVLIHTYQEAYERVGRYAFAPVPVIQPRPRMSGDGPASWAVYLMVARPRSREFLEYGWGSPDGFYPSRVENQIRITAGAKPLELMRRIVRDYTKPGDLVCDPCAGGATTLLAARVEGRDSIGAEQDPVTHAKALERLAGTYGVNPRQVSLFEQAEDEL